MKPLLIRICTHEAVRMTLALVGIMGCIFLWWADTEVDYSGSAPKDVDKAAELCAKRGGVKDLTTWNSDFWSGVRVRAVCTDRSRFDWEYDR